MARLDTTKQTEAFREKTGRNARPTEALMFNQLVFAMAWIEGYKPKPREYGEYLDEDCVGRMC